MKNYAKILMFSAFAGCAVQSHAETVLTETFESPDVSSNSTVQDGATYKKGQLPDNGKWIGSAQGFAADRKGMINKVFGDYTAPSGNNQGIYLGYASTGITTSVASISKVLELDTVYTVSFDAARDNNRTFSTYRVELVAFTPSEGDSTRTNVTSSKPGTVLAFSSGTVSSNDLSHHVTFNFEASPTLHATHVGKNLGVRLIGYFDCPIVDNVELLAVENDSDDDGMDDVWEITHFGDLSHDGTADTDTDLLTDAFEFEANLNPNNSDTNGDGQLDWIGVPGFLSVDEWDGISGNSLANLINNTAFYGPANFRYYVPQAKSVSGLGDDYGIRMRGTVKAPTTGTYRFWVAGDGQCALYLSSDATPFKRHKIAMVETPTVPEAWDTSPLQKSFAINLVQGESYFIEVLMKAGVGADHLAVAWEYPGRTRIVIPGSQLKSFVPNANDQDGDGMLDTWETQVGLNPTDNGFTDLNESAYVDLDNDGLSNTEEYVFNGNPMVAGGNQGFLELDIWKGITGSTVQSLKDSPNFNGVADQRTWIIPTFQSIGDNYGARLRGTLTPTIAGEYHLYVAGDDAAELWFSKTGDRFGKRKLVSTPSPTNLNEWGRYLSQKSDVIELEANQSYHIEALHKDGTGTDHLSVGWSRLLPANANWVATDIDLAQASTWTEDGDEVNVTTLGGDIYNASDKFTYRYTAMTGDCVMTTRVPSIIAGTDWAKAGLVIRNSLSPTSTNVAVLRTANGRIVNQYRNVTGSYTQFSYRTDPIQADTWLRMARIGNQVILYSSEDGESWKRISSHTITLGSTYYIGLAVSGLDAIIPAQVTFDQVNIKSSTPVEVIPSSVLKSIVAHPNDGDDDGLPDNWETQMGLNATTAANGMGQFGDPDNDGVDNITEYQFGGNPMLADGTPGNWTRQLWRQHSSSTIHHFVRSQAFLTGPVVTDQLQAAEYLNTAELAGFGQRVRGRLVAPVSGNYRFWISGSNDFELWLSSDATKFNKRKIASARQWGDGDSVQSTSFRNWDQYPTQSSDAVYLQAGQQYFIEALHKDSWGTGHFSVAWSYTDALSGVKTPRALLNPSALRTYPGESNDNDGDYLPDSWETSTGLSPLDNGLTVAQEGEHGDYDGDLLTNHEEWLLGTNPTNVDTDGDGFDDYRELHFYGSNPTVVDLAPAVLVAPINLANHTVAMGDWYSNADGSLSSTVRRGYVSYSMQVTQPGVHIIELVGRAEGIYREVEEMPVVISIDGKKIGSYQLRSLSGGPGLVEAITPWLSVGTHTVTVLSDNYKAYRRLRIDSLRLMRPAGADLNSNGRPDWVDNQLTNGNGVTACPTESLFSPASVEGKARFVDQVTMQANGSNVPVVPGIDGGWFADVTLTPPPFTVAGSTSSASNLGSIQLQPVTVDVQFEGGAIATQRIVKWKHTDVLTQPDVIVRPGDSMLLTGLPPGVSNLGSISVTISINGVAMATNFAGSRPYKHTFETVGNHTVDVRCVARGNVTTGSMIVTVRDADFGEPFPLLAYAPRNWVTPGVDLQAHVEPESGLNFVDLTPTSAGYRQFRVSTADSGLQHVLARTVQGGPVISTGDLIGYQAYRTDATGDTQIIQTFPNGDRIVMMSVVLPDGLPPGGSVRFKIFVGGVTFLDGTIIKYLTAADFDANGIAYVKFNFPAGHNASICHNMVLLDAQGNEIGQH